MIGKIRRYIEEQNLITKSDRILIGISGGKDSMCLMSVLIKLGYRVDLAHCNFMLRGEDSNQDELFVAEYAQKHHLKYHCIRFNTKEYASKHKLSTQMAARALRYDWFEELSEQYGYSKIAIAHHADDITETFFINLIRGTGLDGLTGIKAQNGKLIRPLLPLSREDIEKYIEEHKIPFREDASNASTKYLRNKIRHLILPEFRAISESFNQTLIENIDHLNDAKVIVDTEISKLRHQLLKTENKRILINIDEVLKINHLEIYLYEILKPYHFSKDTVKNLCNGLSKTSGKQFFSDTHQIIKDRTQLILTPISKSKSLGQEILIERHTKTIQTPLKLDLEISTDTSINPSPLVARLDLDQLQFPLKLRKWKAGDSFIPLGMKQKQKVSDFLINNKVSLYEKEQTYVLTSNEIIVWLVGLRIDNRFKIRKQTKNVLQINIPSEKIQ